MKRIWTAALSFSVFALAACSAETSSFDSAGGRGEKGASAEGTSSGGGAFDGDAPAMAGEGKANGPGGATQHQAGLLTAGVWDDNLNFAFFDTYVSLSSTVSGAPFFTQAERQAARDKWAQRTGATELDLAFVIDTTGSMGDELEYLQAEIDDIAAAIQAKHPQMVTRFGLALYKDARDAYVTRSFDFSGLEQFRNNLRAQGVGGGGDLPEAVPEGLEEMNKLSWRTGAVARVAFWVADAPHHNGTEQRVRAQIDAAVAKDIHVYPVAASGTDPLTELTMRSAAQVTGGRYIFLTDDSGIGGAHAEPHIPCYHVTPFNGAVVRMVESELSGARIEAAQNEIIRTVGNPTNGQCATQSRGTVSIY